MMVKLMRIKAYSMFESICVLFIISLCSNIFMLNQPKTNNKKGFEYIKCSLCNGTGVVSEETVEDYLLSLNEDLIDDYD